MSSSQRMVIRASGHLSRECLAWRLVLSSSVRFRERGGGYIGIGISVPFCAI
jgi:hypothetical protein